jgi:hypothetical protein
MTVSTRKVGHAMKAGVTPWLSGIRAILYLSLELARQTLAYDLRRIQEGDQIR